MTFCRERISNCGLRPTSETALVTKKHISSAPTENSSYRMKKATSNQTVT